MQEHCNFKDACMQDGETPYERRVSFSGWQVHLKAVSCMNFNAEDKEPWWWG